MEDLIEPGWKPTQSRRTWEPLLSLQIWWVQCLVETMQAPQLESSGILQAVRPNWAFPIHQKLWLRLQQMWKIVVHTQGAALAIDTMIGIEIADLRLKMTKIIIILIAVGLALESQAKKLARPSIIISMMAHKSLLRYQPLCPTEKVHSPVLAKLPLSGHGDQPVQPEPIVNEEAPE